MAFSLLGVRSSVFQRCRIYAADDRLEERVYTLSHLEVTRLFFDEATCATVHRIRGWPTIIVLSFLLLWMIIGLFAIGPEPGVRVVLAILFVIFAAALLYLIVSPIHRLVMRTRDQEMTIDLPRSPRKREERIRRLAEAVTAYQSRMAPAPPATPAGPEGFPAPGTPSGP